MIIPAPKFALIQDTTAFVLEVYPGVMDYLIPTACTTVQQHTERKYKHTEKVQVFEMEHTLNKQLEDMSSCVLTRMTAWT